MALEIDDGFLAAGFISTARRFLNLAMPPILLVQLLAAAEQSG